MPRRYDFEDGKFDSKDPDVQEELQLMEEDRSVLERKLKKTRSQ